MTKADVSIPAVMAASGDTLPAVDPSGIFQTVTYTDTAGQSNAFDDATKLVILVSTSLVFVKRGANPTATTSNADIILPPNIPFSLPVVPGEKISALRHTDNGSLYITEVGKKRVQST